MKKDPKHLDLDFSLVPDLRPGDALFRRAAYWSRNAHLTLGGKGIESYAVGYKEAADVLAARFLEDWQGMDGLVYPIVFLYRHALELRLKQVIVAGQQLLDISVDFQEELLDKHKLLELWKIYRKILRGVKCWPADPPQTLDAIEALVKDFDEKDPEGINFRYPHTIKRKGGKPTLPNLTHVDIKNLHEVMQRLAVFFERQMDGIGEMLRESPS